MSNSKGGALIVALLAVALVTSSATWLLRSHSLWLAQAETMLTLGQGKQLLLTGLDWALVILAEDARHSSIDHPAEIWAKPLPPSKVEGWDISGGIEDAQNLFNLNNLLRNGQVSPADVEIFTNLLRQLDCPVSLAQALTDWLDSDAEANSPQGAEDSVYLALRPPYRTANRPLSDLGDLAKVRGFNQQLIGRLRPFVTVLPHPTPVNLNTAPAALLAILVPGLTLGESQRLVIQRASSPFMSMADAKSRLPRSELALPVGLFSLNSVYFRIFGHASIDNKRIGLEALISRERPTKPVVVWKREI